MLSQHFGDAVKQGRPLDGCIADNLFLKACAISSDGARKYYLWHVEEPGRFQDVKSPQGVGLKGSRGIGVGGDGEQRRQVIDRARPGLLHCIQNVAKIPQVAAYKLDLVRHIRQPLPVAAHMKYHGPLFPLSEQHAHHLRPDKACAAGNQCGHRCPPDKGCQ